MSPSPLDSTPDSTPQPLGSASLDKPFHVLILKTAALGDVLRTTSVLPGLAARCRAEGRDLQLTWLTALGAEALLEGHPTIQHVLAIPLTDSEALERAAVQLAETTWDRILSFDDEAPLCRLATRLDANRGVITGAFEAPDGQRAYTDDVAPWFDMGLISVHGKERADQLKIDNRRSHPEIFSSMIGIEIGEPRLELPSEVLERARGRLAGQRGSLIGLNTGAGGRWTSKSLPEESVLGLAKFVDRSLEQRPTFVLLGGPEERSRHKRLLNSLGSCVQIFDATTENSLHGFAGLIDGLDLLVTSDSLAMHIAIARKRSVVAFFAPTSADEIELFGRGAKVKSTSLDYCSYLKDADRSSLTVERIGAAVLECLLRTRGQD
jgi:heptosyltransferase II